MSLISTNSLSLKLQRLKKMRSYLLLLLLFGFFTILALYAILVVKRNPALCDEKDGDNDTAWPRPPITIHCNRGRLGNQMCTMASLYGLAHINKRKVQVLPCNYDELKHAFDLRTTVIDIDSFEERKPWIIGTYLRWQDYSINVDTNIIKGYKHPCSYTFFHHVREEIRSLFRFKGYIQKYVEETLQMVKRSANDIVVGIHVRRTDYLPNKSHHWLSSKQGREVDMEYFQKATDYFKEMHREVVFVAVSDDRQWCQENLAQFGVKVLPFAPSPAHDMATLASCDHVIMTYGTFGFWAGYLSRGTVTYFDNFLNPDTRFAKEQFIYDKMYLPEWIGIKTNSSYVNEFDGEHLSSFTTRHFFSKPNFVLEKL